MLNHCKNYSVEERILGSLHDYNYTMKKIYFIKKQRASTCRHLSANAHAYVCPSAEYCLVQ